MKKPWTITNSGAYLVEEVTEHPLNKNKYLIRIRIIGHIVDYYKRTTSGRYQLSKDEMVSFILESELTEEEIKTKSYSYMELLERDIESDPELEGKVNFKKVNTYYYTKTYETIEGLYEDLGFIDEKGKVLYGLGFEKAY